MNPSSSPSLEGLTEIGMRRGADVRPTLLRVLTDLYVQKPTHTRDEECHYTELALRLLDSVDVSSRAAVAARLAHHLSPPARIVERLRSDLPEVAAPLMHPAERSRDRAAAAGIAHPAAVPPRRAPAADVIGAEVAHELNEQFFAANAKERRLILLNLPIVAPLPALHADVPHDPWIGRRLEAAVLAGNREEFTDQLARSLAISRLQAKRIANDELGEPIVVAAKALNLARDQLCRILLFVNTGHSVERTHALAALYDQISLQAAQDLLAVWQALEAEKKEHAGLPYRHLPAESGQADARAAAAQRTIAAWHRSTREAS